MPRRRLHKLLLTLSVRMKGTSHAAALQASLSMEECRKGRPESCVKVVGSEPFLVIAVWWHQEKGHRRRK